MKTQVKNKAVLLLQDGSFYEGFSIGKLGTSGGEICFNTGMTGYQEVYTDPSYFGQIIVSTSAHIGNYGVHTDESEAKTTSIKGLVVNEFSRQYSRVIVNDGLQQFLEDHNTVGIEGIDTRKLVRHIRKKGVMNALISSDVFDKQTLENKLSEVSDMTSLELSSLVTTDQAYDLGSEHGDYRVAVLDLGIKKSILNSLIERHCQLRVFSATSTFEEMEAWQPDGYFLSNGPGDPIAMDYAVDTVKKILEVKKPLFGICLGHQLLARAVGIDTFKMHHGHRGLNHPVKNLQTCLSEITSQNHGFAVSMKSLEFSDEAELTHLDLNDNTVEGLRLKNKPAFSVQYHPESSPGPHDSRYLFDDFVELLKK